MVPPVASFSRCFDTLAETKKAGDLLLGSAFLAHAT